MRALLLSFLLIQFLLSACSSESKPQICVSAAVSLRDALKEIAAEFTKEQAQTKVLFNFGASGLLAQQIMQGAPVDLFLSASREQSDLLVSRGLVDPAELADCAENRLVLVCLKESKLRDLSELKSVQRLAIGNPKTVPAGAYAEQALRKAGIYDYLKSSSRLVLAEDARQILTYVEGGDLDAGMVYNTDARLSQKAHIAYEVPAADTKPMRYQICLIKSSNHLELARKFRDFVLGPRGKEILRKRGFLP